MEPFTKERLSKYIYIRREVENQLERLARMKNDELIPAQKESDGSQHTAGASDRMANAIIRRMNYQDEISEEMDKKMAELEAIRKAIGSLPDPMEREVLRLRYMDGTGYRHMGWKDVAVNLYGDNDEAKMQAVYRLHGRAMESILQISG